MEIRLEVGPDREDRKWSMYSRIRYEGRSPFRCCFTDLSVLLAETKELVDSNCSLLILVLVVLTSPSSCDAAFLYRSAQCGLRAVKNSFRRTWKGYGCFRKRRCIWRQDSVCNVRKPGNCGKGRNVTGRKVSACGYYPIVAYDDVIVARSLLEGRPLHINWARGRNSNSNNSFGSDGNRTAENGDGPRNGSDSKK